MLATGRTDIEQLARRRLQGEPLQYLEGSAGFADFELVVDERVLIPRPETEGLFELASKSDHPHGVIVDLGTGSGALAIALARRYPEASVFAVDVSEAALELAAHNAARLGVATIDFRAGDLFEPLPGELEGRVDLLVSNPPYVAEGEWPSLPPDVRREPRRALVAGPVGTEVICRIGALAPSWMAPEGRVICEIGETQGEAAAVCYAGFRLVELHQDLAGRQRYLVAWGRR